MAAKNWKKSKTIIANVLATVVVLADHLSGKGVIPPDIAVYAIAGLNVVLRLLTKGPIEW